jgi:hypothetical protein
MINVSRRWLVATAVFGLTACAQKPSPPIPEPPQQVETGSRFVLGTPLSFPAGGAELLFQNERLVTAATLSREMPYCRLAPEPGAARTLAPGRFTVGAVTYDEQGSGGSGGMVSLTRIALSADASRPGYLLSCGWAAGAASRGFVTTQQIFDAIGGQFSMDLLR